MLDESRIEIWMICIQILISDWGHPEITENIHPELTDRSKSALNTGRINQIFVGAVCIQNLAVFLDEFDEND